MDGEFFMALEDNKIMSVALVISEEKILAVCRVYVLPILKRKLDSRERRMSVKLITY